MRRVFCNIFVGDESDYNRLSTQPDFNETWAFIGAAKYPWHKRHAKLDGADVEGYNTKAMPSDQKEYLYAYRDNGLHALYCNLIDAKDPKYIPHEIIDECIVFIIEELTIGKNVLICCNQGKSRAPSIALIFMMIYSNFFDFCGTAENAINEYRTKFYPDYEPENGMKQTVADYFRKRSFLRGRR